MNKDEQVNLPPRCPKSKVPELPEINENQVKRVTLQSIPLSLIKLPVKLNFHKATVSLLGRDACNTYI